MQIFITVYFCDIRSPITNVKFGVETDLDYVYKFCLILFHGLGHNQLGKNSDLLHPI
jgi:hypothetical protein